jgi:cytochrome c oxidase subunit 3
MRGSPRAETPATLRPSAEYGAWSQWAPAAVTIRTAGPGSVLFGATFFSITGLSLLHVIAGIVAIAVISLGFRRGRLDAGHVETTGLYWQFVSLLWMFVFPLVYLMNAR